MSGFGELNDKEMLHLIFRVVCGDLRKRDKKLFDELVKEWRDKKPK